MRIDIDVADLNDLIKRLREPGQRVNAVNGNGEPPASAPPDDFGAIPVQKHRCDHCGSATGINLSLRLAGTAGRHLAPSAVRSALV
jgi:hypothetical protein